MASVVPRTPRPGRLVRVACLLLSLVLPLGAHGQHSIAYEIAFPNAVHHEAEITAVVTGLPTGQPAAMRMSRTSPGRYALHEFAKNVYNMDSPVEIGPFALRTWAVSSQGKTYTPGVPPSAWGWT